MASDLIAAIRRLQCQMSGNMDALNVCGELLRLLAERSIKGQPRHERNAKTTLYRRFGNEMKNGQAMLKALVMGRYRAALDEGAAWATQMGMRTLFRWDINSALLPPDPAGTTSSIRVEFVKPDPRMLEDDRSRPIR